MATFTDIMGQRPGKIIAVHLAYPSRADQRGRRPAEPSYFLKTASSLTSGGEVARPANCELLVFEAEIALVIGTPAKNVSVDEAWNHVGWVAAGNDMGVLDLRYADKGSNLRSKGADGMTPIGGLIEASKISPDALRITAEVDGEMVQDDSSSTLMFSFATMIADLSRFMTLERGDIILTGTPAGSTVLKDGQSVTVTVRSETDPELTSSVTSTAVEGPAIEGPGSMPQASTQQRIDAYGSAEAAGVAEPASSPDFLERLSKVAVATLSSLARKEGYNEISIDGVRPMVPGQKIVGRARTLRYVPHRPDLFKAIGAGFNAQKRAIDSVNEGEVLVMSARNTEFAGTLGDILALRAKVRGAAGIITDGAVRDWTAVAEVGMPVFAQGPHPAVLGRRHVPYETDVTIDCGGALVQVGDIIVADDDGALAMPPALAEKLLPLAEAQEDEEEFIAKMVAEGHSVDGLYPMNAQWREAYEAQRTTDPA